MNTAEQATRGLYEQLEPGDRVEVVHSESAGGHPPVHQLDTRPKERRDADRLGHDERRLQKGTHIDDLEQPEKIVAADPQCRDDQEDGDEAHTSHEPDAENLERTESHTTCHGHKRSKQKGKH